MGYGHAAIAERLNVNPKTVSRLLEQERLKRRAEWKDEDLRSVEFYEGEIRRAEALMEKKDDNGKLILPLTAQNRTGLTNAKLTARQQIDKIAGTHAPTRSESKSEVTINDGLGSLEEEFRRLDTELERAAVEEME